MAEVNTLKCDECSKLRMHDSNHWLEGATDGRKVEVATVGGLKRTLLTMDHVEETHDPDGLKHFCGQECAMKWLGAKLAELRS